jgi:hypothetical protein
MQDTEEIIFKGLDIVGKLLEQPPQEEPEMSGGEVPQEQMIPQEVEPDHIDHESHFSLHHTQTQVLIGSVITAVGLVLVAYFGYKGKKAAKD